MEQKELQKKINDISNNELPLDTFYNDIQNNNQEHFNKKMALKDLEKITNYIIKLQQENYALHETIKEIAINTIFGDNKDGKRRKKSKML